MPHRFSFFSYFHIFFFFFVFGKFSIHTVIIWIYRTTILIEAFVNKSTYILEISYYSCISYLNRIIGYGNQISTQTGTSSLKIFNETHRNIQNISGLVHNLTITCLHLVFIKFVIAYIKLYFVLSVKCVKWP